MCKQKEFDKKVPENQINQWAKLNDGKLSMGEIKQVQTELGKLVGIDYDLLDSILQKLQFFKKYNQATRILLLKKAKYMAFDAQDIIFRQGDIGCSMYVIISGSVSLKQWKETNFGNEEILLTCRYDGEYIGILVLQQTQQKMNASQNFKNLQTIADLKQALQEEKQQNIYEKCLQQKKQLKSNKKDEEEKKEIVEEEEEQEEELEEQQEEEKTRQQSNNTKRICTCQAEEKTYLLEIPNDYFREILMQVLQEELDKKLKVLVKLRMFRNIEAFTLIPIANSLQIKEFKYGEVILNKGQPFEALHIVSNGRIRLVKKQIEYRSEQPSNHIQRLKSSLQNFDFSISKKNKKQEDKLTQKQRRKRNSISLNKFQIVEIKQNKKERLHSFCLPSENEQVEQIDGKIGYYNLIELQNIGIGDMFGTTALLNLPNDEKCAQLTYLADSNQCEVYYLKESNLKYIPDFLIKILMDGLSFAAKSDELGTLLTKNQSARWIEQKQKIYKKELEYISSAKPSHNYFKKY